MDSEARNAANREARNFANDFRSGFRSGYLSAETAVLDALLEMEHNTAKDAVRAVLKRLQDQRDEEIDRWAPRPDDDTRHWPWITEDPDQYFKDAAHRDGDHSSCPRDASCLIDN